MKNLSHFKKNRMKIFMLMLVVIVASLSISCGDKLTGFDQSSRVRTVSCDKFKLEPNFTTHGSGMGGYFFQFSDDASWRIKIEESSGELDMNIYPCNVDEWDNSAYMCEDDYFRGQQTGQNPVPSPEILLIRNSRPTTANFNFQTQVVYDISFFDYSDSKNTAKIVFEKL